MQCRYAHLFRSHILLVGGQCKAYLRYARCEVLGQLIDRFQVRCNELLRFFKSQLDLNVLIIIKPDLLCAVQKAASRQSAFRPLQTTLQFLFHRPQANYCINHHKSARDLRTGSISNKLRKKPPLENEKFKRKTIIYHSCDE